MRGGTVHHVPKASLPNSNQHVESPYASVRIYIPFDLQHILYIVLILFLLLSLISYLSLEDIVRPGGVQTEPQ